MFDRAAYNRQHYAEMRTEPAAYAAYLQLHRDKKQRRLRRKQDKLILEAAKRMFMAHCGADTIMQWDYIMEFSKRNYIRMALAALYPERLQNDQQQQA